MCVGEDLGFGANICKYMGSDSGIKSSFSKLSKLSQIIKITLTFTPFLRGRYTGILKVQSRTRSHLYVLK